MAVGSICVSLFLSWCHEDEVLKQDLLRRLRPNVDILSGVQVEWWEDQHLLLGERFHPTILERLAACDYGVLLLSPGYFASAYITRYELPRFSGPGADKGALPVELRRVPLDGSRDLHGIDRQQIFRYRGKAYAELTGAGRDGFASELATQIHRRMLGDR
jgi:hypothetical protein